MSISQQYFYVSKVYLTRLSIFDDTIYPKTGLLVLTNYGKFY